MAVIAPVTLNLFTFRNGKIALIDISRKFPDHKPLSLSPGTVLRDLSLFTVDTVTSSHIRPTTLSPSNFTHKKPKWHMLAHG